jgi:hypothetical protein
MTAGISLRKVWAIRVAWPVSSAVLLRLLAGDMEALDCDEGLAGLHAILDDANPLGDFGAYQAVAEVAPGWELFRPGTGANPTRGSIGHREVSPSLMVTIHIPGDAPQEGVDSAIARLLAAHSWEVPVIEVSEVTLAALVQA